MTHLRFLELELAAPGRYKYQVLFACLNLPAPGLSYDDCNVASSMSVIQSKHLAGLLLGRPASLRGYLVAGVSM